ncbi:MAG TPA: endopeptidase La [Tenericutes bacterium]|nr:endopeptidase La [Mycoplasmatota bacterium]
MTKINLPVIILKGIVLLPNNEIKLEFDNQISRNIIEVSEMFHDKKILVVTQLDNDEKSDGGNIPTIGIISKINHKINLTDGKTRVIISGEKRAKVIEYLTLNQKNSVLESVVEVVSDEHIDQKEEKALLRKLYKELERYIKNIPYISNSIISIIMGIENLSTATDIIAPSLSITTTRLYEYLEQTNQIKRTEMILEDIYKEEEMFTLERKLDNKIKQDLDNNHKEYMLREKIKAIKEELGESSTKDDEIEKMKERVKELKANDKVKERLNNEIKRYEALTPMSPEINVARNYIDWLLSLPWNNYTEDNDSLKNVLEILNKTHDGLEKVKERIIEYLAVKKMSNNIKSPILCFAGPPGVGKTSLAFSIAEAMNRNFVKISVGGVNDEAEIVGHRKTYLGASPGRIIQSLKKAKSSNPVFLIDEIDKMTKDHKGDPASALLEILDPEQNKYFSDNYIEEEYDLSQVMFIATANYIEDIPEALRDRLEIINLSGYTEYEKLDIARKHLIPNICKEHGLELTKLLIKEKAILKIIRGYTKEAGVRELERQIATVVRKIVTKIIMNTENKEKFVVNQTDIPEYLGKEKYYFNSRELKPTIGVVNGLAYTYFGGDTLQIEVNYFKGNGNLILTGSLGDVMKESAQIALDYIKSNCDEFDIDYEKISKNDIHIHVPEGAIPKDGPSAGIAITTAIISALSNKKIDKTIAMTGEITLRGRILPIGGLKEKSIGAHRSGIKTIIIPKKNLNDLDEIPLEIKESIQYIPVSDYKEVAKVVYKSIDKVGTV